MWRITKDKLDPENPVEVASRDYVEGTELDVDFRLLDDDGEIYYYGKMTSDRLNSGEVSLEPLDWGMWFAGCTELQYKSKGEWVTL